MIPETPQFMISILTMLKKLHQIKSVKVGYNWRLNEKEKQIVRQFKFLKYRERSRSTAFIYIW